ncbi:archaeal heat shock protein Hsp20 [Nitrosopumilus sp. S6]
MMKWFDEFDEIFHRMNRPFFDIENLFDQMSKSDGKTLGPYVYGYSMTVGPDGKPVIQEYGNVKPSLPDASGNRQPVVEQILDEKTKQLRLIVELPGVEKKNISVNVVDNIAHIEAPFQDSKYVTDVKIQHKVDENSVKASYNNGILEVVFDTKQEEKSKGKVVKID